MRTRQVLCYLALKSFSLFFVFFWDTVKCSPSWPWTFYTSQWWPLYSWSSCPHCFSTRITGVCPHATFAELFLKIVKGLCLVGFEFSLIQSAHLEEGVDCSLNSPGSEHVWSSDYRFKSGVRGPPRLGHCTLMSVEQTRYWLCFQKFGLGALGCSYTDTATDKVYWALCSWK